MTPDDVLALALADSIGAADAHERRTLEDRLASLPTAVRAEVAQLYEAAVEIALTTTGTAGEAPSPGVREALLARIAAPSNHTIRATDGEWVPSPVPGISIKILALDRRRDRVSMLVRAEPGATYPAHRHTGAEDCYVIRGSLVVEGQLLRAGDFHHAEGESDHAEIHTDEGVEVMIVGAASDYLP